MMILHGNLMMTTHQILLLLIDEYIFGVTTTYKTDTTLFVWLAQKPKYFIVLHKYVVENPELIHNTLDSAEDFDSPICLACTTAKIITIFKMRLKSHKP